MGAFISPTLIKPLTLEVPSLNNACSAKQAYFFVTVLLPHELLSLSLADVGFATGFRFLPSSISLA